MLFRSVGQSLMMGSSELILGATLIGRQLRSLKEHRVSSLLAPRVCFPRYIIPQSYHRIIDCSVAANQRTQVRKSLHQAITSYRQDSSQPCLVGAKRGRDQPRLRFRRCQLNDACLVATTLMARSVGLGVTATEWLIRFKDVLGPKS